MAAFEIQDTTSPEPYATVPVGMGTEHDRRKVKDECIVAYKVYDSCRRQNCLGPKELGPSRELLEGSDCDSAGKVGHIIEVGGSITSVTMDNLRVNGVHVLSKQPSPFRAGFWDVTIKYSFAYTLCFRDGSGDVVDAKESTSTFNMKATLFGSTGSDLVVGTDLNLGSPTFTASPFVWAEAKAVGLDAKLSKDHDKTVVLVTIGLFSIVKLFRLVHLNVQSKGFCIPDECKDQGDINPCEYFADLDFPMDIFAPPQRKEFCGGVSENIPKCTAVPFGEESI